MLPQNKDNFIILIPSNVTDLENALAEKDIDTINGIYTGNFLLGIERSSKPWLAPKIRFWIQNKRQYLYPLRIG